MRLYLDDDSASLLLAQLLRRAGHDAERSVDVAMAGKDDPVHLGYAVRSNRVLLSHNHRDFENLHNLVDKIKIKGNVEEKLVELACSDPPRGRCHWTLQLLADELVVLGLVDTISTVTVWQALKKMTSSRGSSRAGVCRPTRTPTTYGAWRT